MANLKEPDEILMHFLRSTVTEITRTGLANRQTNSATQSYNGTGSKTVFTLTNQPVCINSVSVGGATMVAYLDYQIDLDNKTVTFTTAPAIGVSNVVINHDTGTNWIYTDNPRDDLASSSYPRLVITSINESGSLQGLNNSDTYDTLTFQIDVLAVKDQACTNAGSDKIQGMDVAQLLARRVRTAMKNNWLDELMKYAFFNPVFINNIPIAFDEGNNLFRRVVTISFDALNVGE